MVICLERDAVCVCVFHSVFFVLSFPVLSVSLLVKFSRRSVKPFEMLRPVGRTFDRYWLLLQSGMVLVGIIVDL